MRGAGADLIWGNEAVRVTKSPSKHPRLAGRHFHLGRAMDKLSDHEGHILLYQPFGWLHIIGGCETGSAVADHPAALRADFISARGDGNRPVSFWADAAAAVCVSDRRSIGGFIDARGASA